MCKRPWSTEEGVNPPGNGVEGVVSRLGWVLGLSLGPMLEQQVLLATDLSL